MIRGSTEAEADDSATGLAVLLVGADDPVRDALVAYVTRNTDIQVSTAASADAARDRVAAESIDCVVAYLDGLAGDAAQFVAAIRAASPDCPVIWLTRRAPGTIDDDVRTAATTIVEQGDDRDEWAFLVEKIRGVVRSASAAHDDEAGDDELYKGLVETARDGLYRLDANGELTYCNASFAAMLGYRREELLGSHASRVMAPGELERGQQLIQRIIQAEDRESDLVEMDWTTNTGDHITVAVHFVVLTTADGTYDGVMGVARDVTERKRREQALHQTTRRLDAIIEASPDPILALDTDGVVQLWNEAAEAVFEYTADEVVGKPIHALDLHDETHASAFEERFERALAGESFTNLEVQRRTKGGDRVHLSFSTAPLRDATGTVTGLITVARDITDRKERERELEATRNRLEFALEATDAMVWDADFTSGDVIVSPPSNLLYGAGIETIDDFLAQVHPADRQRVEDAIETGFETGEYAAEFRITHDGEPRWIADEGHIEFDAAATPVRGTGVARDITDRKRREQAVEALHEATREMMRAPDRQRVADCAVETAKAVLGIPVAGLWVHEPTHDQHRPVAWTAEGAAVIGDPPTFAAGGQSLAWEVFETGEAQLFSDLDEQPGRYNPETPIRSEIIVPLGDHGVLIIGATTREAFDEATFGLARLLAANTRAAFDRIERAQALRERTEQLARQNDRLEEFASVVSHDLRNPLNTAQGYADLVRTECDSEHLDAIDRALDRMETLVADTLTLARQGRTVESPEPVGLDALVAEAWATVAPAGTLAVEFDEVAVMADPARLLQVFENLFRNAAAHAGPEVTVRVGLLADGRGFYVADDGPGMPAAERDAVFDHGHTTSTDGTGFGLSIVRSIVEAHGWDIEVTESEAGGARFDITGVERP